MASQAYTPYCRHEEPPPPYENYDSPTLSPQVRGGEGFHHGYGEIGVLQFRDQEGDDSGSAYGRNHQELPLERPQTRDRKNSHWGYGGVSEGQYRDQGSGYSRGIGGKTDRFVGAPPFERPKTRDRPDRGDFCPGYGEVSKQLYGNQSCDYSEEALEGGYHSKGAPLLEKPRTCNEANREFHRGYERRNEQHYVNQDREYSRAASGKRDRFAGGASLERPKTSHERHVGSFRDDSWAAVPPLPNQGGKVHGDTFRGKTKTHNAKGRENSHNGYGEARQFPSQQLGYPDHTAQDGRGRQRLLEDLLSSLRPGTSHEKFGKSFQNGDEAPRHHPFSNQQRAYSENANWGQFATEATPRRAKTGHGDRGATYGEGEREPSLPRMEGSYHENSGWKPTAPAPRSKTQDEGRSMTYEGEMRESTLPYQGQVVFDPPLNTPRTREDRYGFQNGDRDIPYPNQVPTVQRNYDNTDKKTLPIPPSSYRSRSQVAERGGEFNGPTMDSQVSYQAPLYAQHSQHSKEITKSFTMPPPPPISSDNVDNSSNRFKVSRKPLRSYKSSPEVNLWAQAPQDQSIHETQQAWDIQAQRIIKNGTANRPPLPPRPDLSLKTSIPPHLTESQLYLSPLSASTTPSRSMSRTPSLSGETLIDTPLTAASSVDHIDLPISTTIISATSEFSATTAQGWAEATSPSILTSTPTSTTSSTLTPGSKSSKFKDGLKNRIEAGQRAGQKGFGASKRGFEAGHNAIKTAVEELEKATRISFVCEKDFSILRHSYPLVPYQGTATRLTISIFATNPLPEDRKFWMQQKGFSGDAGMAVKGWLGKTGDWIDVTPSMCVTANKIDKEDEESFNRDVTRFKEKSTTRAQINHGFRETCVLHIPVLAEDGYYQLVLCKENKKKLCTSPIFRLASASTSPSSMRGASPLTMPLEVGAMAGGVWAKATATAFAATAAAPATAAVVAAQTKVAGKIGGKVASVTTSKIATKVMSKGGEKVVGQSITKLKQESKEYARKWVKDDGKRAKSHNPFFDGPSNCISEEDGPAEAYPIHFTAKLQNMYTQDEANNGRTISMILKETPDNISIRLTGTYIGWCRFDGKSEVAIDNNWHKTFISVLPIGPSQLTMASLEEIQKKVFTIQITDGLLTSIPQDCHVEIYALARRYEDQPEQRAAISHGLIPCEAALFYPENEDKDWLDKLLEGDKWKHETVAEICQSEQLGAMKRMVSNISGVVSIVEGQLGKVNIAKFGVRMDSDLEKDRAVGVSGLYIKRDV